MALAAPLQANATIDLLDVNGKEVSCVMDVEIRQNRYGYSYAIDLPAKERKVTVTFKPAVGPLYRLYNPNNGKHFYTGDTSERDHLVSLGWNNENKAWTAPAKGSPVYRLYNPNAGDHFYTTHADEKDNLVSLGWRYEGVGWYSDDAKTVPVYRECNPNAKTGSHNFTTDKAEHEYLISLGWQGEDIGWYGIN